MTSLPVTVVIPARNAAGSIAATVRSVADQAGGSPRIIVVDDASTDDTVAVARDACGSVVIVQGRGAGPGAARNDGVRHVDTEFLAFCDADDEWVPDRLAADLADLRGAPDVGVLLGRTRFEAADEALLEHMVFDSPERTALIPHFGAATMRTAVFAEIGPIDETLTNYEDYEWFLRARDVDGRLVTVDRVVQRSWRHPDSLSHREPPTTRDLLRLLQSSAARQRELGHRRPSLSDLRRDDR